MSIPSPVYDPPFNITRASHVVLTVRDLAGRLFTTHYQIMDIENAPVRWDPNHPLRKQIWGLPAQRAWVEEGTRFPSVEVRPPLVQEPVVTLEKFLAARG